MARFVRIVSALSLIPLSLPFCGLSLLFCLSRLSLPFGQGKPQILGKESPECSNKLFVGTLPPPQLSSAEGISERQHHWFTCKTSRASPLAASFCAARLKCHRRKTKSHNAFPTHEARSDPTKIHPTPRWPILGSSIESEEDTQRNPTQRFVFCPLLPLSRLFVFFVRFSKKWIQAWDSLWNPCVWVSFRPWVQREPPFSTQQQQPINIDNGQITHLICVRLKVLLYDFWGVLAFLFFPQRRQKMSYDSKVGWAPIRCVIWRSLITDNWQTINRKTTSS